MRKSKKKKLFTFTFLYRKTYILLDNIFHIWENLAYIVTFALPFFSRGKLLEMQ